MWSNIRLNHLFINFLHWHPSSEDGSHCEVPGNWDKFVTPLFKLDKIGCCSYKSNINHLPWRGSAAVIMFLASNVTIISISISITFHDEDLQQSSCSWHRTSAGSTPGLSKLDTGRCLCDKEVHFIVDSLRIYIIWSGQYLESIIAGKEAHLSPRI